MLQRCNDCGTDYDDDNRFPFCPHEARGKLTIDDDKISVGRIPLPSVDELPLLDMLLRVRDHQFGRVMIAGRNPGRDTFCVRLRPEDLMEIIEKLKVPSLPDEQIRGAILMLTGDPRSMFDSMKLILEHYLKYPPGKPDYPDPGGPPDPWERADGNPPDEAA